MLKSQRIKQTLQKAAETAIEARLVEVFFGDIAHADLKNLVRAAIVRTPATNDDTARIPADSFEAWWARHKHQVRLCCGW